MDEMQLLREFAKPSELPERDDLAQARAKLMTATSSTAGRESVPLRRRKRVLWGGFTAVGLAAAITAALALAPVDNVGLPVPQAGAAEAVRVLNAAAAAALKMPDTPPRPDQFVYIKSQGPNAYLYEGWFSVDGTHDELIRPSVPAGEPHEIVSSGCRNGKRVITGSSGGRFNGQLEDCVPEPAYDPTLPTDADAMLARLATQYNSEGGLSNANGIAKDAGSLLSMSYLRPDQRSALFAAVAKVPGITLTKNVKDAAGRTGVGISWNSSGGGRSEFVFDPETYAYLGSEDEAQMVYAIVDHVRDRP